MATFSVNDQARRAVATANGSNDSFSFSFQVNATTDVKVYVDGTLKTAGSHYDIVNSSAAAGLNTDGTGVAKFTGGNVPANNAIVTILSDVPVARTSVYTAGGNITATSLEADLDTLTMVVGDREERDGRALSAPVNDAADVDMTLPAKDTRKGTVLGFNATSGNPEAGPTIADVSSLSAITADIAALADIEDGTTATDAISGLAAIKANVTTVAGVSSNVTTLAGSISNVNALAASAVIADMALLANADVIADMALLATTDVISDMNTLATSDIVSDLNTLATSDIVSDINVLATSDIVSDLNTLATSDIVSDINTLATSDIVTDLNLLATSDFVSDLNTLATSDFVSDLNAVQAIASNVTTVADNSSNINTVASNISTISAKAPAAGSSDIVTTGALNSGSISSGFGAIDNGSSAITTTGVITGGSLAIDNITIDGTEIDLSSGDLTIDVAGEIILDADTQGSGNGILLKDAGTLYGSIFRSSSDLHIKAEASDKDMLFMGNDDGSEITALTLDMSDAGKALFNAGASFSNSVGIGTSVPDSSLTIATSSSGEFNALSIRQANNTSGNESRIRFKRTTDAGSDREVAAIVADREGGNDTALVFETNTDGSDGSTERVRIDNQGRVSITPDGTAVFGEASADNLTIYQTGANVGMTIRSDTDRAGGIYFADGTSGNEQYRGYIEYNHNNERFTFNGQGDLRFDAGGTERMKLLSGGNVDISAGHILLDSGYGIDFSATGDSSGTTTSEILDDFEKGTWTPSYVDGTSSATYSTQLGRYTKIGNTVFFEFQLDGNSITGDGDHLKIGGLPYTANSANLGGAYIVYSGGVPNDIHVNGSVLGSQTRIGIYKYSNGGTVLGNTMALNGGWTWAGHYDV